MPAPKRPVPPPVFAPFVNRAAPRPQPGVGPAPALQAKMPRPVLFKSTAGKVTAPPVYHPAPPVPRRLVQRMEAPVDPNSSLTGTEEPRTWYHCACGFEVFSRGYPDKACPQCGEQYKWVKGSVPEQKTSPVREAVNRAQRATQNARAYLRGKKLATMTGQKKWFENRTVVQAIDGLKRLLEGADEVYVHLKTFNVFEDVLDFDEVSKMRSHISDGELLQFYAGVEKMMSAVAALTDEHWKILCKSEIGKALVEWLESGKGCVTSLAATLKGK